MPCRRTTFVFHLYRVGFVGFIGLMLFSSTGCGVASWMDREIFNWHRAARLEWGAGYGHQDHRDRPEYAATLSAGVSSYDSRSSLDAIRLRQQERELDRLRDELRDQRRERRRDDARRREARDREREAERRPDPTPAYRPQGPSEEPEPQRLVARENN